jgi:hypothetical protein
MELDLNAIHQLWRIRLNDARLGLHDAQRIVDEVKRDLAANNIPFPDSSYAYRKAVNEETFALRRFNQVLGVYKELVINGTIPDEDDWRKTPF